MKKVEKVTVLGSGVMGSGIAAHLVNSGFEDVNLLDIVPPKLTEEQIEKGYTLEDKNIRNLISRKNLNALMKSKPPQLGSENLAQYIKLGNVEDDFERCVNESDWVIEVVPEIAKLKNDTFKRIDACRNENTIVTSNTSGIPIKQMLKGCSKDLKEYFLVTHFFNPVRFMKLLEIVEGEYTKQEVTDTIVEIGEEKMGKGIVYSYDVPAFVGNRIGVYNLMFLMSQIDEYGIETINTVFDKKLGYGGKPFSTCDLVGLDTLYHVVKNVYETTNDECHEIFKIPEFLENLVSSGKLGRKTGAGFFKREKVKGKKVDYVIDPQTGTYVPKKNPKINSMIKAKKAKKLEDAIRIMYDSQDVGGELFRKTVNAVIRYSFARAPEISPEGIEGIDKAIKWGFNQKLGPGEVLDVIGAEKVIKNIEKEAELPKLLAELHKTGKNKVYIENENKEETVFDKGKKFRKIKRPEKYSSFKEIAKKNTLILEVKKGGRLYDIGDDVLALEMISENGTITKELMDAIRMSLEKAKDYRGLVIGNDFENFSFGANLDMLLGYILRGNTSLIESVVREFQMLNHEIKYSKSPVVVAKKGMALGGGCELGYGANLRAAHDSFIGLVEFGVGLIPGGGGVKETLVKKYKKYGGEKADPMTYIRETFEQIAYVKIAMSAHEAKELGYLSESDGITMNSDFLLADAKQDVIKLSNNYQPPKPTKVLLPGRDMKAALYTGIELASASNQLPPMKVPEFIKQHFKLITKTLADVLSGGDDVSAPGKYFTEEELLKRERDGFLRLTTETSYKERFSFLQIASSTLKKPWHSWASKSIKDSYLNKVER